MPKLEGEAGFLAKLATQHGNNAGIASGMCPRVPCFQPLAFVPGTFYAEQVPTASKQLPLVPALLGLLHTQLESEHGKGTHKAELSIQARGSWLGLWPALLHLAGAQAQRSPSD